MRARSTNPWEPIYKEVERRVVPPNAPNRYSGSGQVGASPGVASSTTIEDANHNTKWPFTLGLDELGGTQAFLRVRGEKYDYLS